MKKLNFNLRGISPSVMASLKKESAKLEFKSVNAFILDIIERNIGHIQPANRPTYHDLDKLAGTWTEKEEKAFKKSTEYFEKIDEDIWK